MQYFPCTGSFCLRHSNNGGSWFQRRQVGVVDDHIEIVHAWKGKVCKLVSTFGFFTWQEFLDHSLSVHHWYLWSIPFGFALQSMQVVLFEITKKNVDKSYISYFCIPFMAIKDKKIQMVENEILSSLISKSVKFIQKRGKWLLIWLWESENEGKRNIE